MRPSRTDGTRGSSGPNEHTFLFRRSFSKQNAESQLTRLAHDSDAATPQDAFLLGPTAFIGVPIIAATAITRSGTIPALLRPSETVTKNGRQSPAFQLANARVNAAAVNSVVHVYIEVRDRSDVHRIAPTFAGPTKLSPSPMIALHVGSPWPLSSVLAFWREVGTYGVFDFEHHSPPLCKAEPKYHKSWIYGVGVYASGAGISKQLMDSAGSLTEEWLAKHPVKCPMTP